MEHASVNMANSKVENEDLEVQIGLKKRRRRDIGPFKRDEDNQLWLVDKRFNAWLDDTTVHGIVHVFKGKSTIKRLFWLVIFMTALIGCVINVIERLEFLLDEPTSTSVRIDANTDGVPFPAVTICNLSPLTHATAQAYGVENITHYVYSSDFFLEEVHPYYACEAVLNGISPESKRLKLYDLLQQGQLPLERFINFCTFGAGTSTPDAIDCTDQFKPFMTNYGLCYTFNGDPDTKRLVRISGQRYGLQLSLNLHQNEFGFSLSGDSGIKISITPQGSIPEPDEHGIAVFPGSYAYISMTTERSIDNTSKSNCKHRSEGLRFFPRRGYSQTGCKIDDYVRHTLDQCDCIEPVVADEAASNCTLEEICCVTLTNIEYTNENTSCPVECDRFKYITSTSYSKYPSTSLASELSLKYNVSTDYLYDNLISLSIYFESTTTVVSETVDSYSISAFLSDLGGQLGLFLGASVISMMELGLFLYEQLITVFCPRKVKNKIKRFQEWSHVPEVTGEIENETSNDSDNYIDSNVDAINDNEDIKLKESLQEKLPET